MPVPPAIKTTLLNIFYISLFVNLSLKVNSQIIKKQNLNNYIKKIPPVSYLHFFIGPDTPTYYPGLKKNIYIILINLLIFHLIKLSFCLL